MLGQDLVDDQVRSYRAVVASARATEKEAHQNPRSNAQSGPYGGTKSRSGNYKSSNMQQNQNRVTIYDPKLDPRNVAFHKNLGQANSQSHQATELDPNPVNTSSQGNKRRLPSLGAANKTMIESTGALTESDAADADDVIQIVTSAIQGIQ